MRSFSWLISLLLLVQTVAAQDPCDPPLTASFLVFPTTVCAGGQVTITFTLPPDDGDAFDVIYSVNGVSTLLPGILDGYTTSVTITQNTTIRLQRVTNNDDDDDACFTNFSTQINVTVSEIDVDVNEQNPGCGQNNGSIEVNANGGTEPYQYSLNGGNTQNSPVFSGLSPGDYTINVVDNTGCTGQTVVTLVADQAPELGVTSQTNPVCGQNNGSVTLSVDDGLPPFQYSVNGGPYQSNPVFGNLGAGVYLFMLLDAANCASATTVTLTSPGAPALGVTSQTNPGCGQNTGSVTLSANGGIPPYQYSINGGAYQNGVFFGSLGAGTYSFSVLDAANCASATTVTLTSPGAPALVVTNQTNPGCGQNTGSVTLSASGGAPPYQYSINGGAYQNGAFFGSLGAGTYSFSVLDAANCTSATTVTLTSPGAPALVVTNQTNPGCGQNTGSVTLSASGGAPPYQYSINGGAYQNGAFFGSLGAGTYLLSVLDAANCTNALSVNLTDNSAALPEASIIATDTRGCSETIFQLTANLPAGTTGVWSCSGCNIANPTQPQLALTGLPPGNTVVNWMLSAPDCPNYSKATITITVFAPPLANTDAIFPVTVPNEISVDILANDVASAPVFTEIIRPPQKGTVNLGSNNELVYQPALQAQGLDTLIYSLCYEECPNVCDSAMVIFQIFSEEDPCFITGDTTNIFTNGLTPNNDNINDKLVFRIVDKVECEVNYLSSDLIVYNRWGDVVYKSSPYQNDWGGTNRDGSPLPPGVYYFVLRVDDKYSQFGNVIIIR